MKRHLAFWIGILVLLCEGAYAQREIKIWPGKAPGSENWAQPEQAIQSPTGDKSIINVSDPTLTIYLPDPAKSTGAAVVVCPGGGLRSLTWTNEGIKTAEWLTSKGIAAFVLKYRLVQQQPPSPSLPNNPPPGRPAGMQALTLHDIEANHANANPAPNNPNISPVLQMAISDGQQAIRIIRRDSANLHIDPNRIGIIGFSAGGGVAVGTAVTGTPETYPNFVVSIYGPSLVDVTVPPQAGPLFIAVGANHFNVTNGCIALFEAWNQAGKPVELHVFDTVKAPPFAVNTWTQSGTLWTDRFYEWIRSRGFIS